MWIFISLLTTSNCLTPVLLLEREDKILYLDLRKEQNEENI